jgi:TRAP-type C4-dicarboxylate transport system substrate-binding protein
MKKKGSVQVGFYLVGVLLISFILGGFIGFSYAAEKTVVLKYASYAPPTHLGTKIALEVFPMVEKLTQGRVKVEVYHSETLIPVNETMDAVNRGIADLAFLPLPYISGQVPWLRATLTPGLIKDFRGAHDSFKYGLKDMVQQSLQARGLKNVMLVGIPFCPGASYIMTKGKKIAKLEDLKGLKIACPSKGDIETMKLLGASPVGMTGAENYESLTRGIVDGVISNIGGFYGHKMYEPGDYLLIYPLGAAMVAVLASQENLARLSEVDRNIVLFVGERRVLEEAFDLATGEQRMLEEMKSHLKEVVYLTPEEQKKWEGKMEPLLNQFLKETGAEGQKAVEIIRKYN